MKVQIWELIKKVAILVKDCFEIKILDVSIKDTLITKVLLDRSEGLLIISKLIYLSISEKVAF